MTTLIDGLKEIPALYRALALLAGGVIAGALLVVQAANLPARVTRLEDEGEMVATALAVLLCRAVREDEGKDPRDCLLLIRDMDAFLQELAR